MLLALSDLFGMDQRMAATMAGPLGGGVGRMREVCGAVTGMSLVVGLKYPMHVPSDKSTKLKSYELVRNVASEFESKFGSVICRELLKLKKGEEPELSPEGHPILKPGACSCAHLVEEAVRIVATRLNAESGDSSVAH